jgi:hypothetical protein
MAMIFPQMHFTQHVINDTPPATLGLATKTGWPNSELSVEVMKHYIQRSDSSKDNLSLLILDNYESHNSTETIDIVKDKGVVLLSLPPHTSNKLQPLDVRVFSSFK